MNRQAAVALVLSLALGACVMEDGEEFDESAELAIADDFGSDAVALPGDQMIAAQACGGGICSATVTNGHGTALFQISQTVARAIMTRHPTVTDHCSGSGTSWRIKVQGYVVASGLQPNCGTGSVGAPAGYTSMIFVEVFNTATATWTYAVNM